MYAVSFSFIRTSKGKAFLFYNDNRTAKLEGLYAGRLPLGITPS